jgi:hypothetical protein
MIVRNIKKKRNLRNEPLSMLTTIIFLIIINVIRAKLIQSERFSKKSSL